MALLAGVSTTSCEDMLDVETGDKMYVNANDTLYSYLGIMRCVQDVAERQVVLGEIRGDLMVSTEYATDSLYAISNFDNPQDGSCSMLQISDYYNVINNCNFYIANADTAAIKANQKYMIPEYAQVQTIRAWAYLQLVKNYGAVPFITEPVHSLDVIKNFDYQGNLVTKETLVDRILEEGLEKFVDTNYPHYEKYSNGAVSIDARLCFIPVRLVLGDLYLLRGANESDYRKAAKYYFDYLRLTNSAVRNNAAMAYLSRVTASGYDSYGTGLLDYTSDYTYNGETDEIISVIPGAANKGFGTMLTRVADIFGYTTSSSQDSKVEDTEDGSEGDVATSGAVAVTPTYKRQYSPSMAYTGVNEEQTYVNYAEEDIRTEFDCGDARAYVYTRQFSYEGTPFTLSQKAAHGSAMAPVFHYTVPIYRKTLVWLRLAEAINRAGYPEFAFAILKDGLSANTMPVMATRDTYVPVYDSEGNELLNEKGEQIMDTVPERYIRINAIGTLYYVTDSTQLKSFNEFLDFTDDTWNNNFGIHARGCGMMMGSGTGSFTSWTGTYTTTNISGYRDSIAYDYDRLIGLQLVDVAEPTKADTINAIENVIVDELALETAFEGNRFTDLVRVAEHKNASGHDGTEWLANKIANRGVKKDATDPSITIGERNEELYGKLKDVNNWYFAKPEWSVK